MDYYAIWPVFLITALTILVASTPLFRALDTPPTAHSQTRRIRSIDGLRGYLALAVVFHHVAILHAFLQKGTLLPETWAVPPSRFYSLIGPAGVSMFFMITGYLFWSRMIQQRGKPNWGALYIGRVFRIGPLYLLAVGVALLLDHFSRFNYMARVSGLPTSHAKQIISLMMLGTSVYPDKDKLLAGVTWSIQYEWFFYASLPLLVLVLLLPRFRVALLGITLLGALCARMLYLRVPLGTRTPPIMIALFLIGMLCASLQASNLKIDIPNWLASASTVALVAGAFAFPDLYTPVPILLLGLAFYLICTGCTIFGLLSIRPAIRLGDVSYGIYLLQGLILSVCFRPSVFRAFALSSPLNHWILTLVAVIVLLSSATATYIVVERPGIALGRRIARNITPARSQ